MSHRPEGKVKDKVFKRRESMGQIDSIFYKTDYISILCTTYDPQELQGVKPRVSSEYFREDPKTKINKINQERNSRKQKELVENFIYER